MKSYFDRLLNGTKKDIIDELELAIRWARDLTPTEWAAIEKRPDGLRGYIREAMEMKVEE